MTDPDFLRSLGVSALGTRLRRLFERLNGPVSELYRSEVGFEQRWFALTLLLNRRGPCAVKDAVVALGTSHVSILQVARAMEGRGLLTKASSETDRRSTILSLTPAGEDMAARIGVISERVDRAARVLLEEAAPELMGSLDGLDDALNTKPFSLRLRESAETPLEES